MPGYGGEWTGDPERDAAYWAMVAQRHRERQATLACPICGCPALQHSYAEGRVACRGACVEEGQADAMCLRLSSELLMVEFLLRGAAQEAEAATQAPTFATRWREKLRVAAREEMLRDRDDC